MPFIRTWLYWRKLCNRADGAGHEPGGTVVQVGQDVTHLKEGDRVAIEPGIPC